MPVKKGKVNEKVSTKVLAALSTAFGREISFVDDLTYSEYSTELREAMMRVHPDTGGQYADEETFKILSTERDRIRGKNTEKELETFDREPSAKVKKTKISTSKFFDKKEKTPDVGGKGGAIVKIGNSVTSIVETLKEDQKQDKKQQSWFRKMVERFKRRKKENKLEFKALDGIKKTATKLLKPFKSAWTQLLDFIGKVILGRVLFKILNWFGNKENKGKLDSIIKFFQDWWPTMLAAYLLFGNTFTSFVAKMLGRLVIWGVKLAASVIPKLVTALGMMGPKGIKLLAKAGSGALLFSGGGEVEESYPSFESEMGVQMEGGGLVPNLNEGDISVNNFTTNYNGGGLVQNYNNFITNGGLVKHFNEGGLVNTTENIVGGTTENINNITGGVDGAVGSDGIDGALDIDGTNTGMEQQQDPMVKKDPVQLNNEILDSITQFIGTLPFSDQIEMVSPSDEEPKEFKKGGFVSGPGGVDKVPARLTAGEFVMSKGAVQKYGVNTLASMNAAGGGTNRPTVSRSRYNGGGLVKNFAGGGPVGFLGGIGNIMGGKTWGGEAVEKESILSKIQPRKTNTVITPSEKKKVTVVYEEEKQNMSNDSNAEQSSQEIPQFDVTLGRSSKKISLLGISV